MHDDAATTVPPATPAVRLPLIDAIKGLACLLIVLHHTSIYGPMGEAAAMVLPRLIDWFSTQGRLAVQVFLAIGGYLAASSLAPRGVLRDQSPPWRRLLQRYARLTLPLLAAVAFAVLVEAGVRGRLAGGDLVPAVPTLTQLVAHALLLQDLFGQSALSAGIWYVAIDFQLFALALAVLYLASATRRSGGRRALVRHAAGVGVLLLVLASLLVFNLNASLDNTALYFFGAYGLGMFAWWIGQARQRGVWALGVALLLALGLAALVFDWRPRIAVALATALLLALSQRSVMWTAWPWPALGTPLLQLGRVSYSLFLIHFPVILLLSALYARLAPVSPWAGVAGAVVTVGCSVAAATLLYRLVESRPATWRALLLSYAVLLLCGGIAILQK